MHHLLRVRMPRALALCLGLVAALSVPTAARADIAISSFKAGPVAAYNNQSGLPYVAATVSTPGSYDTGCAYGTPTPFNASPLWEKYSVAGADTPLALETQAGASTDFCVSFRMNPEDAITGQDLEHTVVQLPVGTQADIDNAAKCTVEQFARDTTALTACPLASQIGTSLTRLQVPTGLTAPAPTRTHKDAPGRVFALSTPSDKAALLGVALVGSDPAGTAETKFTITVTAGGDPKIGLLNTSDTLNRKLVQNTPATPIAIHATSLRFWGKAAAHPHVNPYLGQAGGVATPAADFFRVGTTCQTDQTTTLTTYQYTDANEYTTIVPASTTPQSQTSTYKLTGCDGLGFSPTFSAAISGETTPGGHPQLDVKITSPSGDEDLGATKITLPAGIATDLTRIQNACPQATFQAGGCPEAATIGSVKATLSGINADVVSGDVVMVKVDGKQLPALGLNFKGRLQLRVFGISDVDGSGRLVSTFSDLPSLPQRSLDITLVGGSRGILQTDPTGKCVASAYDATLTGQNGKTKSFSLATSCTEQFNATLSNSTKTRPVLLIGSSVPTGKKISTLRIGLPKGMRFDSANLKKSGKVTYAPTGFDKGADLTKAKAVKLGSKAKFTFPASNGFSVLTHTGVIRATSAFAKSTGTVYVEFRAVYTDGTKVTKFVALKRAG